MKRLALILFFGSMVSGCSFSEDQGKEPNAEANSSDQVSAEPTQTPIVLGQPDPRDVPKPKVPNSLKIERDGKNYVLVDIIKFPKGHYTVNRGTKVKGEVYFPFLHPTYKDDSLCKGLGYSVHYINKRQTATNDFYIESYVNGVFRPDSLKVSDQENLELAVFAKYEPLADFLEYGNLPSKFDRSFQPSSTCRKMCRMITVKPIHPPNPCKWRNASTGEWLENDVLFSPMGFDWYPENTGHILGEWKKCNQIRDNDDLRFLYDKLADQANCPKEQMLITREWYWAETKIAFERPRYIIRNFSELVTATTQNQGNEIDGRLIQYPREMGL